MTRRYITPGQKKILAYFVDERLHMYGGPRGEELHLRFDNILELNWPRIIAGYIPGGSPYTGYDFKRKYQELSDGWRMNIGQGLLVRTDRQNQYKLSPRGEDYVLEVLWKDE